MMHRTLLICAVLTLGAGMAQAQSFPGNGQFFSRIDGNGDGGIERSELAAAMAARAARQASSGGAVPAGVDVPARVEAVFASADSNADGSLSRAELQAKAAALRPLLARP